MVDLRFLTDRM